MGVTSRPYKEYELDEHVSGGEVLLVMAQRWNSKFWHVFVKR